ncbi:MAG: hypothetical protein PHD99_05190, partial [Candidatus Moranbacteria bacterium]|nr:hypothetical protein [Candidatus Moranbacteria bacterium]
GAVTDDQIRKGEIQITVVATGFDVVRMNESPIGLITNRSTTVTPPVTPSRHTFSQPTEEPEEKEQTEKVDQEGLDEIRFTNRKIEPAQMIIEEKIQPRNMSSHNGSKEFAQDEDLEIPAFIRRKMKK